ncbi:MAG: hypothetical protein H7A32_03905 [Deltaproteobacteria bacterium]|nr:hypothetical protein [Deltaproteobacteria bacterium]
MTEARSSSLTPRGHQVSPTNPENNSQNNETNLTQRNKVLDSTSSGVSAKNAKLETQKSQVQDAPLLSRVLENLGANQALENAKNIAQALHEEAQKAEAVSHGGSEEVYEATREIQLRLKSMTGDAFDRISQLEQLFTAHLKGLSLSDFSAEDRRLWKRCLEDVLAACEDLQTQIPMGNSDSIALCQLQAKLYRLVGRYAQAQQILEEIQLGEGEIDSSTARELGQAQELQIENFAVMTDHQSAQYELEKQASRQEAQLKAVLSALLSGNYDSIGDAQFNQLMAYVQLRQDILQGYEQLGMDAEARQARQKLTPLWNSLLLQNRHYSALLARADVSQEEERFEVIAELKRRKVLLYETLPISFGLKSMEGENRDVVMQALSESSLSWKGLDRSQHEKLEDERIALLDQLRSEYQEYRQDLDSYQEAFDRAQQLKDYGKKQLRKAKGLDKRKSPKAQALQVDAMEAFDRARKELKRLEDRGAVEIKKSLAVSAARLEFELCELLQDEGGKVAAKWALAELGQQVDEAEVFRDESLGRMWELEERLSLQSLSQFSSEDYEETIKLEKLELEALVNLQEGLLAREALKNHVQSLEADSGQFKNLEERCVLWKNKLEYLNIREALKKGIHVYEKNQLYKNHEGEHAEEIFKSVRSRLLLLANSIEEPKSPKSELHTEIYLLLAKTESLIGNVEDELKYLNKAKYHAHNWGRVEVRMKEYQEVRQAREASQHHVEELAKEVGREIEPSLAKLKAGQFSQIADREFDAYVHYVDLLQDALKGYEKMGMDEDSSRLRGELKEHWKYLIQQNQHYGNLLSENKENKSADALAVESELRRRKLAIYETLPVSFGLKEYSEEDLDFAATVGTYGSLSWKSVEGEELEKLKSARGSMIEELRLKYERIPELDQKAIEKAGLQAFTEEITYIEYGNRSAELGDVEAVDFYRTAIQKLEERKKSSHGAAEAIQASLLKADTHLTLSEFYEAALTLKECSELFDQLDKKDKKTLSKKIEAAHKKLFEKALRLESAIFHHWDYDDQLSALERAQKAYAGIARAMGDPEVDKKLADFAKWKKEIQDAQSKTEPPALKKYREALKLKQSGKDAQYYQELKSICKMTAGASDEMLKRLHQLVESELFERLFVQFAQIEEYAELNCQDYLSREFLEVNGKMRRNLTEEHNQQVLKEIKFCLAEFKKIGQKQGLYELSEILALVKANQNKPGIDRIAVDLKNIAELWPDFAEVLYGDQALFRGTGVLTSEAERNRALVKASQIEKKDGVIGWSEKLYEGVFSQDLERAMAEVRAESGDFIYESESRNALARQRDIEIELARMGAAACEAKFGPGGPSSAQLQQMAQKYAQMCAEEKIKYRAFQRLEKWRCEGKLDDKSCQAWDRYKGVSGCLGGMDARLKRMLKEQLKILVVTTLASGFVGSMATGTIAGARAAYSVSKGVQSAKKALSLKKVMDRSKLVQSFRSKVNVGQKAAQLNVQQAKLLQAQKLREALLNGKEVIDDVTIMRHGGNWFLFNNGTGEILDAHLRNRDVDATSMAMGGMMNVAQYLPGRSLGAISKLMGSSPADIQAFKVAGNGFRGAVSALTHRAVRRLNHEAVMMSGQSVLSMGGAYGMQWMQGMQPMTDAEWKQFYIDHTVSTIFSGALERGANHALRVGGKKLLKKNLSWTDFEEARVARLRKRQIAALEMDARPQLYVDHLPNRAGGRIHPLDLEDRILRLSDSELDQIVQRSANYDQVKQRFDQENYQGEGRPLSEREIANLAKNPERLADFNRQYRRGASAEDAYRLSRRPWKGSSDEDLRDILGPAGKDPVSVLKNRELAKSGDSPYRQEAPDPYLAGRQAQQLAAQRSAQLVELENFFMRHYGVDEAQAAQVSQDYLDHYQGKKGTPEQELMPQHLAEADSDTSLSNQDYEPLKPGDYLDQWRETQTHRQAIDHLSDNIQKSGPYEASQAQNLAKEYHLYVRQLKSADTALSLEAFLSQKKSQEANKTKLKNDADHDAVGAKGPSQVIENQSDISQKNDAIHDAVHASGVSPMRAGLNSWMRGAGVRLASRAGFLSLGIGAMMAVPSIAQAKSSLAQGAQALGSHVPSLLGSVTSLSGSMTEVALSFAGAAFGAAVILKNRRQEQQKARVETASAIRRKTRRVGSKDAQSGSSGQRGHDGFEKQGRYAKSLNVESPVSQVRSLEEGIERAQAMGLDQQLIAQLRKTTFQLKDFPELQEQYLGHVKKVLAFQEAFGQKLDGVFTKFPDLDYSSLAPIRERYNEALASIAKGNGPEYSEALLLAHQLDQLEQRCKSLQDYAKLSDEELILLNIPSKQEKSIIENPHAYSSQDIESILGHPLLQERQAEVQALKEAHQKFERAMAEMKANIDSEHAKLADAKPGKGASIEEVAAYEAAKKEISDKYNRPFAEQLSRLKTAWRTYFKTNRVNDAGVITLTKIQVEKHARRTRALQDMDYHNLSRHLSQMAEGPNLSDEAKAAVANYQSALEKLDWAQSGQPSARMAAAAFSVGKFKSGVQGAFHLARGKVKKAVPHILATTGDFVAMHEAAVERALLQLMEAIPAHSDAWDPLLRPSSQDLSQMPELQQRAEKFYTEEHALNQNLRTKFEGMKQENNAAWDYYDKEVPQLWVEDIRFQRAHAEAVLDKVRELIGETEFEERFAQRQREVVKRCKADTGRSGLEECLAVIQGQEGHEAPKPGRSQNRALEQALSVANELRGLAHEALNYAHETQNSEHAARLPQKDFDGVSALMLPYVKKTDDIRRAKAAKGKGLVAKIKHHWEHTVDPQDRWAFLTRLLLPAAFSVMKSVGSANQGASNARLNEIFLNFAIDRIQSSDSRVVADPHVARVMGDRPMVVDSAHNSWYDFLKSPVIIAARAANAPETQEKIHNFLNFVTSRSQAAFTRRGVSVRNSPIIAAKKGLDKMVPVAGPAMKSYIAEVGDSAPEFDQFAVTPLGRALALGDAKRGRLGASSTGVFSELTMAVAAMIGPFAFRPFASQSTLLSPYGGGRGYGISDRGVAAASTSPWLLMGNAINAYTMYPKPDTPTSLRFGASTIVTQVIPNLSLNNPGKRSGADQGNFMRTMWMNMGEMPEYQQPIRSIEKILEPFARPVDLSVEAKIEAMAAGSLGLYPDKKYIGRLLEERALLLDHLKAAAQKGDVAEVEATQRQIEITEDVIDVKTHQAMRRDLSKLELKLKAELADHPNVPEAEKLKSLQKALERDLEQLDRIEQKVSEGKKLSRTEQHLYDSLATHVAGRTDVAADAHPVVEQLETYFNYRYPDGPDARNEAAYVNPHGQVIVNELAQLSRQVEAVSDLPQQAEVLAAVKQKQEQAEAALIKQNVGEKLTPVEELLLEKLKNSTSIDDATGPQDELISALRDNELGDLSSEQVSQIMKREEIRQYAHQIIDDVPGSGRGTIDPIAEHAKDIGLVSMNAAGQVVGAPHGGLKGAWKTYKIAMTLTVGMTILAGATASGAALDLATRAVGKKTDYRHRFYGRISPVVSRAVFKAGDFRFKLNAQSAYDLEQSYVALQTGRPIIVRANHADNADIINIQSLFGFGNFIYKDSLEGAKYGAVTVPAIPALISADPVLGTMISAGLVSIPAFLLPSFFSLLKMVQFPMNRSNRDVSARQIQAVKDRLNGDGENRSVIIYIPGTRSKTGTVGKSQVGAADIALDVPNIAVLDWSMQGNDYLTGKIKRGAGYNRVLGINIAFDESPLQAIKSETDRKTQLRDMTANTHEKHKKMFIQLADDLYDRAAAGDPIARGQWVELNKGMRPGVEKLRKAQVARDQAATASGLSTDDLHAQLSASGSLYAAAEKWTDKARKAKKADAKKIKGLDKEIRRLERKSLDEEGKAKLDHLRQKRDLKQLKLEDYPKLQEDIQKANEGDMEAYFRVTEKILDVYEREGILSDARKAEGQQNQQLKKHMMAEDGESSSPQAKEALQKALTAQRELEAWALKQRTDVEFTEDYSNWLVQKKPLPEQRHALQRQDIEAKVAQAKKIAKQKQAAKVVELTDQPQASRQKPAAVAEASDQVIDQSNDRADVPRMRPKRASSIRSNAARGRTWGNLPRRVAGGAIGVAGRALTVPPTALAALASGPRRLVSNHMTRRAHRGDSGVVSFSNSVAPSFGSAKATTKVGYKPVNVLVIGSSAVTGVGTSPEALRNNGFSGAFAQNLADASGRVVNYEVLAQPLAGVRQVHDSVLPQLNIGDTKPDMVVISLGMEDAAGIAITGRSLAYGRRVSRILRSVREQVGPDAKIVISGIPPVQESPAVRRGVFAPAAAYSTGHNVSAFDKSVRGIVESLNKRGDENIYFISPEEKLRNRENFSSEGPWLSEAGQHHLADHLAGVAAVFLRRPRSRRDSSSSISSSSQPLTDSGTSLEDSDLTQSN